MPRGGGEEQLLIDGNALAKDHTYFRIANVSHSPDHRLLAYAVDTKGSEFYAVHLSTPKQALSSMSGRRFHFLCSSYRVRHGW